MLVEAIPMRFSLVAIAVYHWQIPKWLDPLAVTQPIPDSLAFLMAKFILVEKQSSVLLRKRDVKNNSGGIN